MNKSVSVKLMKLMLLLIVRSSSGSTRMVLTMSSSTRAVLTVSSSTRKKKSEVYAAFAYIFLCMELQTTPLWSCKLHRLNTEIRLLNSN